MFSLYIDDFLWISPIRNAMLNRFDEISKLLQQSGCTMLTPRYEPFFPPVITRMRHEPWRGAQKPPAALLPLCLL